MDWGSSEFYVDHRTSVRGVMVMHSVAGHFCDVTGADAQHRAVELVSALNNRFKYPQNPPQTELKFDMTKCIICEAPASRPGSPFCEAHEFSPFYHHIQAILNFAAWRDDDMNSLDESIKVMERSLTDMKDRRKAMQAQPDGTDDELMGVVYMAREVHAKFPKLAYIGGTNPFAPRKVVAPLTPVG